jgi:hypothetical protein
MRANRVLKITTAQNTQHPKTTTVTAAVVLTAPHRAEAVATWVAEVETETVVETMAVAAAMPATPVVAGRRGKQKCCYLILVLNLNRFFGENEYHKVYSNIGSSNAADVFICPKRGRCLAL